MQDTVHLPPAGTVKLNRLTTLFLVKDRQRERGGGFEKDRESEKQKE